MKIIAESEEEFEELIRTFKYMHDFCYPARGSFNWRFWQWIPERSIFNTYYPCLDQEEYPLLSSMIHFYRVKHAHLEGVNGILESNFIKRSFYIEELK